MADYTFVGGGGLIFRAPVNTALPSSTGGVIPTDTQLTSAGFVEVGEVSDAGLTFTPSREKKDIKNWAGTTLRTIYTSHTEEFKFALDNYISAESLKAAYGDANVSTTEATAQHGEVNKTVFNDKADIEAAWVFLMQDGDKIVMVYAPKCVISGWDTVSFTKDDIAKHGLTATAVKGEAGNTVEIYTDNGVKAS